MGANIQRRRQTARRARPGRAVGRARHGDRPARQRVLVLAGLAAQATTRVSRVYHLDRGYERIEEKLGGARRGGAAREGQCVT